MRLSSPLLGLLTLVLSKHATAQDPVPIGGFSGKHTDIPRWCGKPYQSGSPNYDPGGMLHPPKSSPTSLLHLQIQPRHSIYDSSEESADFIVSAEISSVHGEPFGDQSGPYTSSARTSFKALDFDIRIQDTDQLLVSDRIALGSTTELYHFDITTLKPRLEPYNVVLSGRSEHSTNSHTYIATTELYYLPAKTTGSTVKIDNLHGGFLVANSVSSYAFAPLLPFGFYTSCSGYLNTSLANVSAYAAQGFNAINPVCAFTDTDIGPLFDWLDETNIWYQYDMRGTYLNLSSVAAQIPLVKDRPSFLSWYTADEPDGAQYALNSTQLAYALLRAQDPYHPTGLVLNCANYYFGPYTAGADYIMEDAYPIGIDPNYSKWNTSCNSTYGDCGCDDCAGSLTDISDRLDHFAEFQRWLGRAPTPKPLWAVLQAFSGEGYWSRDPTPSETWAMLLLGFNHGAKGVMSWLFPASATLNAAHGAMAKVAARSPVVEFLIGADPLAVAVECVEGLDVAVWTLGSQVLVSVVNLEYGEREATVRIALPVKAKRYVSQPWGTLGWELQNGELVVQDMPGLATSFVVLEM